jgi:hypothetical protein
MTTITETTGMNTTATNLDGLFGTGSEDDGEPPAKFALWYRDGKGSRWEVAFKGQTQGECLDHMADDGSRRFGQWYIAPVGQRPSPCKGE